MKKYGLRRKKDKKLVGFYVVSSHWNNYYGEEVTEYALDVDDKFPIWTTDSAEAAKWVLKNPTSLKYNPDYTTPNHKLKPKDYEVIEIVSIIKPVAVSLPSLKEVINKTSLSEEDRIYKLSTATKYTYYDLSRYIKRRNNKIEIK